jgi:hypothetical protein
MSELHRWWHGRRDESFWLEVTRRPDLGENLKAPQTNEQGREFWSYALLKEVREGDVIFHYDGIAQAIVARSRAVGTYWEDELLWAARGTSARAANIVPHPRLGWYLGLEHFQRLPEVVSLDAIRMSTAAVQSMKNALDQEVGEPLYFPFELGSRRPLRPMQGYLFKLPRAFVEFFGLAVPALEILPKPLARLGTQYREADELAAVAERDPFAIDPALVERGVRGHATTQNRLASYLRSVGLEPRSPSVNEPNFDLAWQHGDTRYVAEVKSITCPNEEKQLRLGLGQVLRYADQLGPGTIPVLMLERCPADTSWTALFERLGVIVAWSSCLHERLNTKAIST